MRLGRCLMPKKRQVKIKIALVTNENIVGMNEVLQLLPDDWEVGIFPNTDFTPVVEFKPHFLICRGYLSEPILNYLKDMQIPKIIFIPVSIDKNWDMITTEPDWVYLDKESQKNAAKRIELLVKKFYDI